MNRLGQAVGVFVVGLTISLVSGPPARSAALDSAQLQKKSPAPKAENSDRAVVFGTAFFYNENGDMFTNRHVVEKCNPRSIRVRIYGGEWVQASLIAVSDRYDLAAIATAHHTNVFGAIRVTSDGHVLIP